MFGTTSFKYVPIWIASCGSWYCPKLSHPSQNKSNCLCESSLECFTTPMHDRALALSNMKKSPEDFDGRGMAIAGLATGYVTIGFFILGLIMIMAGSAAFFSAL